MRILVLQSLGLGDFLTALPAIRAIRRHYLDAQLTWMGESDYLSLAEPIFDDVVEIHSLKDAPRLYYDIGINLHGSGPQSHEVLELCDQVMAFYHPKLSPAGPPWDPQVHMRALWIGLLAHHGIRGDKDDMKLPASGRDRDVLIHAGSRDRDRWWPLERLRTVVQSLPDVRVIAAKSDQQRALEISERAEFPTLQELVQIMQSARLVIGVDSGVAHLAYAMQKPTVTLFGPSPASRWGPPSHPRHIVLGNMRSNEPIHPDGPCSPYLLEISAEDVLQAAWSVLSNR